MASLGQDIKRHVKHRVKNAVVFVLPARLEASLRARINTEGLPERARLRDGSRMQDNSLASLDAEEIEEITQEILGLSDEQLPVTINGETAEVYRNYFVGKPRVHE